MPYNLRKRPSQPVAPIAAPPKRRKKDVEEKVEQNLEVKVEEKPKAKAQPKTKEKAPPKIKEKVQVKTKEKAKVKAKHEPDVKDEDEIQVDSAIETKEDVHVAKKSLFSFGSDSCGELGLRKIGFEKKNPTQVLESIQQVSCGAMHSITLTVDGKVLTYGCNDEGALGRVTDGDEDLEATPTEVPFDNKVIKVSAGDSHSVVLTDKNEVYIFGNFRDEHGSVGLTPEADGSPLFKPLQIMAGTKFTDIASGSNHILLLDADGVVYSFGVGDQGQLGRLKPDQIEKGVKIGPDNRELFLKPQKVSFKDVDPQRTFICDAVYAGNMSSFATNTDKKKNRLAAWGLNNYYQLGYKGQKGQLVQYFPKRSTFTCSTSMIKVGCGQHHTLFLTKTGRVYSAGKHLYGMLGLGEKVDKEVCPAKLVETLGNSTVDIAAGINTSFAVDGEGKLFSWGMGGLHLGFQSTEDVFVPKEVTCLDGKFVKSVSAGSSFTSVVIG